MSIAKKIQYNTFLVMASFQLLFVGNFAYGLTVGEELVEQQKPLIITTIKPLAIIAKSAVGDKARVEYLQSAVQSAHDVSFPVSSLIKINQADLILWIGGGFEARIGKSMALLPASKLLTVMDLDLLAAEHDVSTESSVVEEGAHQHEHQHEHLQFDPHVWLNPLNGNIIAENIQQRLGLPITPIMDAASIARLKMELAPFKNKHYLTHHDAFGHFAFAFDLRDGQSIRDVSGASQGARSQYLLRQKAKEIHAKCIFVEPQYSDKDAQVIARELKLTRTILDSQGLNQPLSSDGYSKFIHSLVAQFKVCFQ